MKKMSKQNNNGYYRSRFYFNGKQYETTGKTQKDADKKAALKQSALENGEIGISVNMSVSAWCREWLDLYKRGTITEGTFSRYKAHVENLIIAEIGNMKLKDVHDVHLQRILNARKGYSKSDTKKLFNTIKAIFKQARISRLIPYDPAEGSLKMPLSTEGTRRSITDIERAFILNTARTHRSGLWVKMMLYCGLRPGELMALQWKDIDFKRKLVIINKAKESGSKDFKEPKTKAGNRNVPIPDIYLEDLKAAKDELFAPVFTQETTEKAHTDESFRKAWKSFKRAMDIEHGAKVYRNKIIISTLAPDLIPYYLRHTYCTDLEIAGVPINVAKYLMGHSDISVTAKIYTHTSTKAVESAAEKINANINNKSSINVS